ncbi:MAG: ankyrin repeat domain-containing protein, partial [Alphaproteobacteria bacterium]
MQDKSLTRDFGRAPAQLTDITKNREYILALINQGGSINAQDKSGRTPLHYAAYNGDIEVVSLLLKKGCKTSIQNNDGLTPLHFAVQKHDINGLNIIKLLIDSKANPFILSHNGASPKDSSDNPVIKELLVKYENESIHPDALSSFEYPGGLTSLHYAASRNWSHVIDGILAKGANIDAQDEYGRTPLYIASWKQSKDTLITLLQNHANPFITSINNKSPISICKNNEMSQIIYLYHLRYQKPLNLLSLSWPQGYTSLHFAISSYQVTELLNFISVAPYLINKPTNQGLTPLHCAAQLDNITAIQILIDHNADKNAQDLLSLTPLSTAIMMGKNNAAAALISNGASLNVPNQYGTTALH